jgi:hypothetical protein
LHRRIWLDHHHIPVTLSPFGFSVLLTGLASSDRATIAAVSLVLKQGHLQLGPSSALFRAAYARQNLPSKPWVILARALIKLSQPFPEMSASIPG